MDPLTAVTIVITLATFVKDLIELGQNMKDSIQKVGENSRRISDLTNEVLHTLAELANLTRRHADMVNAPTLLTALRNLKEHMLRVHEGCQKLALTRRSFGGPGVKAFILWWNRKKIEGEIRHLKEVANDCYIQFLLFSTFRTELATAQTKHIMGAFGDRLTAYHETVLKLPIARGVHDEIFCVVNPIGENMIISMQQCRSYAALDRIVRAYLPIDRPEAGGHYVQRGDYDIVSGDGKIIFPVEFTGKVEAGMQFEMSIVKRQVQHRRDKFQNTQCPHCHRNNTHGTRGAWLKCAECGREYRIDVQDQDTEEIMSPQVAQEVLGNKPAETEVFRLVHIYAVFTRYDQLRESVDQMADLLSFAKDHDAGPLSALKSFADKIRGEQAGSRGIFTA